MRSFTSFSAVMVLLIVFSPYGKGFCQSKVVYVDSYHEGYGWSDGITQAIQKEFAGKNIDLSIIRMDSKRHTEKPFIINAAEQARERILDIKPDVIIASDDNASRYLIMPYFKNSSYPVVFCGINWDASIYGYPYDNATGMIEVADVVKLYNYLKNFAKGKRMAYLAADVLTARKEGFYYKSQLSNELNNVFVSHFDEWVKAFIQLQSEYDILIVGNNSGINDWNDQEAQTLALTKTRIPTGAIYEFMMPYSLIGYVKDPGEQGEWAAKTAVNVLKGTSVATIPLAKNSRFKLIINRKIAASSGFSLNEALISSADALID